MRSLLRAAVTALTFLPVLAPLASCKSQQAIEPRSTPRLVQVTTVQPAAELAHTYTGVVAARVQSELGFRVQGKVTERLVDTGETVQRGQPLMRIDPTDYKHAITVQVGDVAATRARWVNAAADEQRYRGLVDSGAISQLTYDQAKAAAASARALLSAAEAQERLARDQGDYSTLLADADGTVVETLAEPGQVVTAGQPVIRLAHAGAREASVSLPETERPKLGSEARASLYGDVPNVGARLRQLSDAADPRTRTFEARFVLAGEGASAPLGATVTIHLAEENALAAMQVPLSALDDEGHGPGVWVFDPPSSRVSYRLVKVRRFGTETVVLSEGVRANEQIVASGGHFLRVGERVQPVGSQAAMR